MGLGNRRWKQYGAPEIEKLYNDRIRVTRRFHVSNERDLYDDTLETEAFEAFNELDGEQYGTSAAETRPERAFDDCRLVDQQVIYLPQQERELLQKVYETLTDTFVEEVPEQIDFEMNGLRRVTRVLIANPGTDYTKKVNTSSISHQLDSETAITLKLAKVKILNDNERFRRVEEEWLEEGLVSQITSTQYDQLIVKQEQWFGPETDPSKPIISKNEDNVNGYPVTNITYIDSGLDTQISFNEIIRVVEPGTVEIKTKSFSTTNPYVATTVNGDGAGGFTIDITTNVTETKTGDVLYLETKPPTQTSKKATVKVKITDTPTTDSPVAYVYGEFSASVTEIQYNRSQDSISAKVKNSTIPQVEVLSPNEATGRISHTLASASETLSFTDITYILEQKGTKPNLTGLFRVDVDPIFKDISGTQYYREVRVEI